MAANQQAKRLKSTLRYNFMKKKPKLITSFFFFWMFLILFKFGGGLHYSLISPLGEKLLPLWLVGIVMSIASLIQLSLDVQAGKMLDRFGYKKMLTIGTGIFVVAALLLSVKFTPLLFISSVFLAALGWLFFGPGINAYSLSHAKKEESGKFMALRDIFGSVGIVLASIGIPVILIFYTRFIGMFIAVLLLIALIFISLSPKDSKKIKFKDNVHEKTHHQRKQILLNLPLAIRNLNPASSLLIGLNFAGALFYGVVWFVIPIVIAHSLHEGNLLGIGLGMFDFAIVIVGSLLYSFIDKANKKKMVFIGLLLFSVASMLLGLSYGLLFLVFAFLSTSGDEIASLSLWAWLHGLDKRHNRDGLISGIINLSNDLGWATGPLMAGLLYVIMGPKLTVLIGAIPLAIMLIIYQCAIRKHVLKISVFDIPRRPHKSRHKS